MSIRISKRRPSTSGAPTSSFHDWFVKKEAKNNSLLNESTKMSSFYYSTLPVNPQKEDAFDEKTFETKREAPRMKRSYSAFRNTQSRVNSMRQDAQDISRQLRFLREKTKRSRLEVSLADKQLNKELEERRLSIQQQISTFHKLVKHGIKQHESRSQQIRGDAKELAEGYRQIKRIFSEMEHKIHHLENQCGFAGLKHKLYK